jgi:hypothetical protein
VTGATTKAHGKAMDNLDNGDKAFSSFQLTLVIEKDGPHVMNHKWQVVDGTGRLKGVKGQGTCKDTGRDRTAASRSSVRVKLLSPRPDV